jgi:hypothetical protein
MRALSDSREAGLPTSPRAKLALIAEILSTYRRVRRLMRGGDVATAVDTLREGRDPRPDDPRDRVLAERLAGAVVRTLRLPGADSRCLTQSLVLFGLLARREIGCSLVIGAQPGPAFAAHAWVEHGGTPLMPDAGYPALLRLPEPQAGFAARK